MYPWKQSHNKTQASINIPLNCPNELLPRDMQIVCGIMKITPMSGENNGISCVSPSLAVENVKGDALSNGTTTAVQGESRKSIDGKFKCANCKCARECSGKRREAHFITTHCGELLPLLCLSSNSQMRSIGRNKFHLCPL
jgi:hypothetical protein